MCFEPCSKPAETCCLCCLEERAEVLLKADSVTDFRNIFQGTYKGTRLKLTEAVLISFLLPTVKMVNHPGNLWKNNSSKAFSSTKNMTQFFQQLSTVFCCRKNLKLYQERLHQLSYFRCHNKDIKILVALLPTLKLFLSAEINSAVTEAAAWNCSLKKVLTTVLKNSQEITSAGVSFLKNKTKREKKIL